MSKYVVLSPTQHATDNTEEWSLRTMHTIYNYKYKENCDNRQSNIELYLSREMSG